MNKKLSALFLSFFISAFCLLPGFVRASSQSSSSDEILNKLLSGNLRFQRGLAKHQGQNTLRLKNLSQPVATILVCPESTVSSELVFDQGLGTLYVTTLRDNQVSDKGFQAPLLIVLGQDQCTKGFDAKVIADKIVSDPLISQKVKQGSLRIVAATLDLQSGAVALLDLQGKPVVISDKELLSSLTLANIYRKPPSDGNWEFKNKTTFNAIALTGNSDTITLGGDEKFTTKKKNVANVFTSGVTYARDNVFSNTVSAKTTSRNIFAKDKVSWEFSSRMYSYFGGSWLTNQTSGIDHQFDGFTGLGYKLLMLPKHTLTLEAGYNFKRRNRVAPFPDEAATHNAAFGLDDIWQITDKTSLENEMENVFDMKSPKNVKISSLTSLQVEIIKHLALSFGFKLQFDNNPVPTFKKWDTTSTAGVTFLF